MLFTKDNAEKIKGLIEELNEVYEQDETIENRHIYLVFNADDMKVYEVCKHYTGGLSVEDWLDEKRWYEVYCKDITLCFKNMLMYIGE